MSLARLGFRNTIVFIAINALFNCGGSLENPQSSSSNTSCETATLASALYGTWTVEISSTDIGSAPLEARMVLEKNAEYPDSLAGWLLRGEQKILVVGDWQDGELSLEESDDGSRISAVWEGKSSPDQCASVITGTRRVGEIVSHFVMRRAVASW
jgi:hypothetical protein